MFQSLKNNTVLIRNTNTPTQQKGHTIHHIHHVHEHVLSHTEQVIP